MITVDEFDKIYHRLPVKILNYETTNGVLTLDGRRSVLTTSGESLHFNQRRNENGWFDLSIEGPDGKVIYLHNSIILSSIDHNLKGRENSLHSTEIYPNFVIDDIRGLDETLKVKRIIFRITDFINFFYYRYTEPLLGFDRSNEQISSLYAMRFEGRDENELFNPQTVHVVHDYPSFLSVKVEDRTYEVYSGRRETFGIHKMGYETLPTASITFDNPIEFDDAINHTFGWKRLFCQLAMMPLSIEETGVQSSNFDNGIVGNVYLTNSAHKKFDTKGYYSLSPREQPFNEWSDRNYLGEAHRDWLSRETQRRLFRISLDNVIEGLSERSDPSQLVTLCAAVESLEELGGPQTLPSTLITEMAAAAQAIAEAKNQLIPLERIQGLLGTLTRPSLAHKIKALGSKTTVKDADVSLICKAAVDARHRSAHGGNHSEQRTPILAPTIRALAALCAKFDLETCGFSASSTTAGNLMSGIWLRDAVQELKGCLGS